MSHNKRDPTVMSFKNRMISREEMCVMLCNLPTLAVIKSQGGPQSKSDNKDNKPSKLPFADLGAI